jgi:hypothetical protein
MGNLYCYKNRERCDFFWFQSKTTDFITTHICNCSLIIDYLMILKEVGWSQWRRRGAQVRGRSPAEIAGSNPSWGLDVCYDCCVLPDKCLCDELIIPPEESYRLQGVVVCDLETSWVKRLWSTAPKKKSRIMCRIGLSVASVIYWSLRFRRWCRQRRFTKRWFLPIIKAAGSTRII